MFFYIMMYLEKTIKKEKQNKRQAIYDISLTMYQYNHKLSYNIPSTVELLWIWSPQMS